MIPPERAATAAEHALGVRLAKPVDPDSPALANLLGSYAGGDRRRQALVLVFDSRAATDQVTGGRGRLALAGAATVVVGNVVAFYRGRDSHSRRARLASALRAGLPDR